MEESCNYVLNGKQLNISENQFEEDCSVEQMDFSSSRGVDESAEGSPFMAYRLPPMKHKEGSRKINFHMEALTPIFKNTTQQETSSPFATIDMDDDKMDISFQIKCPNVLRLTAGSPIKSPGPFYLSKSRLQSLARHSSRTTSTPCNAASNVKAVNKGVFSGESSSNEDGVESSRRKLFVGKNDSSSMIDGAEEEESKNEGAETSSTGLSWREGMSNLIGDMSAPFRLPLHHSKHQDLKAINSETMADLLRGKYDKTLERFLVVDCRYPYEFEGGHIKGAINIFSQDDLLERLFSSPNEEDVVIIFHCEFSSERGPKMMRFSRNHDRETNKYPNLSYPETYLLEGGYSSFFPLHPDLCNPSEYRPMLHPDYLQDLKEMQSKKRIVHEEMNKNAFIMKFLASPDDLNNSDDDCLFVVRIIFVFILSNDLEQKQQTNVTFRKLYKIKTFHLILSTNIIKT